MVLLRILGGWSLIIAIMALVYDLTLLTQGIYRLTSVGRHWFALSPSTLNLSQAGIERHVHPYLWNPVLTSVLTTPAFLVFGLLGIALYAIGRRRPAVNIFAN